MVAGFPLFWYLQYGSSALSMVVITGWLVRALRRAPAAPAPSAIPVLSARDRWWALVVVGGCAGVGAVERAARWWAYWGSTAKPWELIPAVCFGAGAGLVPGLLLYAVGVRVWRPPPQLGEPEHASAESGRPAGR